MFEMVFDMIRLFTRWKPDWLYELMPYLYMITGTTAILLFDTTIGHVSGLLLIIAACLIIFMRFRYRARCLKTGDKSYQPSFWR